MHFDVMAALARREAELNTELERFGCPKCADEIADPVMVINCANLAKQLRLVKEAQKRVEAGEYGVCQHCEHEIAPNRLEAMPWAKHCLSCQKSMDRNVKQAQKKSRVIFIPNLPWPVHA
jgi:hypothetical protein